MTRTVTLLATFVALVAPATGLAGEAAAARAGGTASDVKENVEKFGAPLAAGETVPVAEVLAHPDAWAGKEIRVEGVVRRVCSRKGCWMEIGPDAGTGPGCRVTFKNYGFFVPKDSAGARATLAGTVLSKTLSRARVDHLLAEGAQVDAAEDGTAREITIVATGVELRR